MVLCSLIRIFAGELRNSPARMGDTLAKSKLSALGLHHPCKVCCRDGGMVDTRDLKSLGHNGCAGSSPARGTHKPSSPNDEPDFLFSRQTRLPLHEPYTSPVARGTDGEVNPETLSALFYQELVEVLLRLICDV